MQKNIDLLPAFQCPNCKVGLSTLPSGYYCRNCNAKYFFSNDIISFANNKDFYYGEIEKPEMLRCLTLMKENGFTTGLSKYLDNASQKNAEYLQANFNNLKINAFEPFLAANNVDNSSLLVLGSGWGSIIATLSTKYSSITAMDMTKEVLMALRYRLTENNINNVTLVQGGDTSKLSFCDAQFDAVILTGMFDYIDMLPSFKSTKGKQLLYSEIYRILKPKGFLVLGLKNKFSFVRFFGQPESNFKFNFKKKEYKASIRPNFLKNLLKKLKFATINILATKPTIHNSNEIIPITKIPCAHPILMKSRFIPYYHGLIPRIFRYILKRTKLERFFVDNYIITASKSDVPSILDDVINKFSKSSGQGWHITKIEARLSGYLLFSLLSEKKQQAFGRVYLYPFLYEYFTEQDNLRKDLLCNDKLPASIRRLIPHTLFNCAYQGYLVTIEEHFDGFLPDPRKKDQPWFFDTIDFINTITKATINNESDNNRVNDVSLRLCLNRIKRPGFHDFVMPIVDYVNKMLRDSDLSLAFSHGDLHHNNLIIDKTNRLKAVIDWDSCYSRPIGYDMLYFLSIIRLGRVGKQINDLVSGYEELDSFLSNKERNEIEKYFNEVKFPLSGKNNMGLLQSLMWLNVISGLIEQFTIMNTHTWNKYFVLPGNNLKRLYLN